jgi:hypothetical protein
MLHRSSSRQSYLSFFELTVLEVRFDVDESFLTCWRWCAVGGAAHPRSMASGGSRRRTPGTLITVSISSCHDHDPRGTSRQRSHRSLWCWMCDADAMAFERSAAIFPSLPCGCVRCGTSRHTRMTKQQLCNHRTVNSFPTCRNSHTPGMPVQTCFNRDEFE